jgi:hypothetical protein
MPGDFSAAQLSQIVVAANTMWEDPRQARDLMEPIEVLRSIAENQKVSFNPVLVNNSCQGFKVAWLKRCGVDAVDCSAEAASAGCELEGDEIDADDKTYTSTGCFTDSFTVWDDDCKGLFDFEQKVAFGSLKAMQNIKKKLNTAALAFLNANKHDNSHIVTGGTNSAGNGTYFASGSWTPELISVFAEIAMMNRIKNPVFVSGTNLWGVNFNANYNFSNSDQKDQLLKMRHFKDWYWDPETVDVTLAKKATLMFDAGAVGFFTKNEFSNMAPREVDTKNGTVVYAMPDKELAYMNGGSATPLMYDVYTQPVCKTAAKGVQKYGRVFKFMIQYGFILSPEQCNDNTGIIEFVNGTAPV